MGPLPLAGEVDEEGKTLVFEHEKTSPETLNALTLQTNHLAFSNEARI